MIELYTGRVGASKSYHGSLAVARELAKGRVVATNIDLVVPQLLAYIERRYGVIVDESAIIDLRGLGEIPQGYKPDRKGWSHSIARRTNSNRQDRAIDPKPGDLVEKVSFMHLFAPPGSQIVIDEAHTWFGADCKADTPDETFVWMTQSRKQQNDIILITQDADNMDKRFKRLAQFVWIFRDMRTLSVPGVCRWPFQQFKVTQLDAASRQLMWSKIVRKDPEVFKIYNSFAMLTSVQRAPIPPVKAPTKKKKRFPMKFAIVVVGLLVALGLWKGGSLNPFAPMMKQPAKQAASQPVARPAGPPPAPKVEAAPAPAPPVPAARDLVVVRTSNYGTHSRTSIGPVGLFAVTPLGVVTEYDGDRGVFIAKSASGQISRVVMLYPSQVAGQPDSMQPRIITLAGLEDVKVAAEPLTSGAKPPM